jgi:iron complex outermembrane receptor protein
MRSNFPYKRRGLSLAVMIASAGFALPVVAQDSEIEEVIVTGSFIRGTPGDAPSPVNVIDRAAIDAQGATGIWDVIRNMEVNSGSDTSVAGSNDPGGAATSQLTGTAQVNLRNLGANSTLTLINGKRFTPAAVVTNAGQEFVDLNSIPLVMTDRVEVLTDGGSALYGSDAVAGVVNVIMRTDFEGFELYGDIQGVEAAGDLFDQTISAIWGWESDDGDTNFVISGEYFERDPVGEQYANFFDADAGQYNGQVSGVGVPLVLPGNVLNPAYIQSDLTALNIAQTGNRNIVLGDPLCAGLSGPNGPLYTDNRYSDLGQNQADCFESDLDYTFISLGQERASFAASFEHRFSDNVEFYSFFQHADSDTQIQDDGVATSRSVHLMLPPPGASLAGGPGPGGPGPSPVNAFVGSVAELGFFAAAAGNVRPGPNDITNSPLDIRNGGIGTGMFGGQVRTGDPRTGNIRSNQSVTSGVQAGLRGDFVMSDRSFNWDVSYSWSGTSFEQNYLTLNRENTELALQGLGGPNCTPNGTPDFDFVANDPTGAVLGGLSNNFNDFPFPGYILNLRESLSQGLTSSNQGQGGCEFFNPFLTKLTDPALANSQELQDWMTEDIKRADKRNKLAVFDAVISGELFELSGGTAQFAAGAQYRERSARSRAPALNLPGVQAITGYDAGGTPDEFRYSTNNLECSNCIFDFEHTRDVRSVFLELSLPIIENLETQIALRYEDYGGQIGSNVSPKIAASYRPIEDLLIRASWSQSFRAPNIGVLFESFESSSTEIRDPISTQAVRAGLLPPTVENGERENSFTLGAPNPNLGNEESDTFNIGIQWTPSGTLDGLSIGADIWRFEVSDRVLPQAPIAALQPELDAFALAAADLSNYVDNASVQADASPQFASCDPTAIAAQFGVDSPERLECVVDPRTYRVEGAQRLAGSTEADLVTIVLPAINSGGIVVDGIDLKAGYTWDNDWGRFRVAAEYTHVRQYDVSDIPGLGNGLSETGRFDAAGTSGQAPIVRSLPDNRGNINMSWTKDGHRLTVINRHIGSYDALEFAGRLTTTSDALLPFLKPKIESYQTWDMNYTYTHAWGNSNLGSTNFTLGMIDAFNEEIPQFRFQEFDRSVFDGRGRRIYARALWSL